MPSFQLSFLKNQSETPYVLDLITTAFKYKASSIQTENQAFNIKAQQKRYKWATNVINNNDLTASTASLYILLDNPNFFNDNPNINYGDLVTYLSSLNPNGLDFWNFLAGVNQSDL